MAEAKKRLYLVRFAPAGEGTIERLVNAKSPAGALRAAVAHLGGSARYAEQGDIFRLAQAGADVIEEGDVPQGELEV